MEWFLLGLGLGYIGRPYSFYSLSILSYAKTLISNLISGDNLLVGTRQGHLLMYKVATRYGDSKHEVQLLRYNKNFSKKPIQQLEVVPEYEILVRLSGKIQSFCSLECF